jgi:hypothetical protein
MRACYAPDSCVTEPSPFQSALDGMWFTLNALTTLGYGDIVPTGRAGKLIAAVFMCLGLLLRVYPMMIFNVNYEEERGKNEQGVTSGRVASGEKLRALQRSRTKALEVADPNAFQRPLPVYFFPREDNLPRQLQLIGPDEARYEPIFYLLRAPDGTLYTQQTKKASLELSMRLYFDTLAAQELAIETINTYSTEANPFRVERARFFPVVRIFLRLDVPRGPNGGLLKDVRLVEQAIDIRDLDAMYAPVTLEVLGHQPLLDEQARADLLLTLHRCRLHVTALVAHEDPCYYDVPIFLGTLNATLLMRELQAHKGGVVYVTEAQLMALLNGIEQLLDLGEREQTVIINAAQIQREVCRTVILRAATPCEDPQVIKESAFLYGKPGLAPAGEIGPDGAPVQQATYHGIFVRRLTKDMQLILCHVRVLAVKPKMTHTTLLL